jgi:hypothetical protein
MAEPRSSDRNSVSYPVYARVFALAIALLLGWFLEGYARACWNDYWLLKDGRESMAVVTYPLWTGHNAVAYRYTVDGKAYTGKSGRNYRDPRYRDVQAGVESVVYYSVSHPWLSSLRKPEGVGTGWPLVVLLVLPLETLALITMIHPRSRWALNFTGQGSSLPSLFKTKKAP